MLKKLYDRCVELARHKFSKPLLGFVSFIESFFFPVPPDLMIVPMVVAKRDDYLKIFLIATVGSVLGGLFGYMLGVFFLDSAMVIIEFYGYEEKVFEIQNKMSTRGGSLAWLGIMFLAGFTPLPFKVFTITSGVINFNLFIFFFICLFTRGLRFFLVSYLTYLFGKKFGDFIEKKGALWLPTGGHVEENEHPYDTVVREAKEELNISAIFMLDDPLFLTICNTTITPKNPVSHKDISFWYVLKGDSDLIYDYDKREFHSIFWFDFDQVPFEKADPNMKRFLEKLLQRFF